MENKKLEALENTFLQWAWVELTGNKKWEYPDAKGKQNNCFLCDEYKTDGNCGECPISLDFNGEYVACQNKTSFADYNPNDEPDVIKTIAGNFKDYISKLYEAEKRYSSKKQILIHVNSRDYVKNHMFESVYFKPYHAGEEKKSGVLSGYDMGDSEFYIHCPHDNSNYWVENFWIECPKSIIDLLSEQIPSRGIIPAIKEYRDIFGCGLKEAKEDIERIRDELGQ